MIKGVFAVLQDVQTSDTPQRDNTTLSFTRIKAKRLDIYMCFTISVYIINEYTVLKDVTS